MSKELDSFIKLELDEEGYPTEETLEFIKNWKWDFTYAHAKEFLSKIKQIWYFSSLWGVGWEEEFCKDNFGIEIHQYKISTFGWSGNEAIINALENNILWHTIWYSSTRGGHYVFNLNLRAVGEGELKATAQQK